MYPGQNPSTSLQVQLRPTYYAYVMYNKYFGDQMVKSGSPDPANISIWASTDTRDAAKLKPRITNLSGAPITSSISIKGFAAKRGEAYVLSSTNPTDISDASALSGAPTTINGVKLDGADLAGSLSSIKPLPVGVAGGSVRYVSAAYSSTAIVLSSS